MYSYHHLLVSLVVGGALGVALGGPPLPLALAASAVLGVGIDLDHFLVARVNAGDWGAVARGLDAPRLLFVDQSELFGETEVWPLQRLLTHHLLAAPLVGGAWLRSPELGLVAAAVLYAHVLADLAWDNLRHDRYLQRAAEASRS